MLVACSIFQQKLPCLLSCLISTQVLHVKNNQKYWVIIVTVHAHYVTTVYNYTRTKVPSFNEHIWQLALENNHELQLIPDFILIIFS